VYASSVSVCSFFLTRGDGAALRGGGEFDSQKGWTALIWAAWHGHADCVRLLIDAGADKEAKTSVRHWSVVMLWRLLVFFSVFIILLFQSFPSCFTVSVALSLFKVHLDLSFSMFFPLSFSFPNNFFSPNSSWYPSTPVFLPFDFRLCPSQELCQRYLDFLQRIDFFFAFLGLSRSHSPPSTFISLV
jgi:hypothetical protein